MEYQALDRLMNVLLLHSSGGLRVEARENVAEKTNDDALLDILKDKRFLKELFDSWGSYLYEGKGLEEAFFGRPRRGLGSYSQRLRSRKQADTNYRYFWSYCTSRNILSFG